MLVTHDKTIRGISKVESLDSTGIVGLGKNGLPVLSRMEFYAGMNLFDTEFDADAHFVTYDVLDQNGVPLESCPRINKEALGQIRAMGGDIICSAIVLDLDLQDMGFPKDTAWDDIPDTQWPELRLRIFQTHPPEFPKWTMAYATMRGARLVHMLATPVPAGIGYEKLLRSVHDAYHRVKLPVDRTCKDWTRVFRAPQVTREDPDVLAEQNWEN